MISFSNPYMPIPTGHAFYEIPGKLLDFTNTLHQRGHLGGGGKNTFGTGIPSVFDLP